MHAAPNKPKLIDLNTFLQTRSRGILAPAAGGCSQYTFGTDVEARLGPHGGLELLLPPKADGQQILLQETTLSLRLPIEVEPDGTEISQLILRGNLEPSPSGHPTTWQRFSISNAHEVNITGRTHPVTLKPSP